MGACEVEAVEQMEILQFTDFVLSFTNLISHSVHILYADFPFCLFCPCVHIPLCGCARLCVYV